ncbi:Hypothetical protein PHPALM_7647 [Phytophthora palmivora]|uniref:G domain-containing protein n=1 Tax=Phytophthora palmivora TaxID=4796 RepID=A0A2P4YBT4_9STRA|nr:Hypothetical protein PHPALM_7647 [Phytophthora palmivora]
MNEHSNQLTNSQSPVPQLENYLFLGNPGTGKSTLINCLAGSAIFNSGLSYGGGLTQNFQKRIHDNVNYMDTPGLADRKIQEKAAAAITEALQQSGTCKLFFMFRLENGRVMSDDLATIEIVLNSIDLEEIPFAIIVNNVKKRQYTKMMEKGTDYLKVVMLINSITYKTPHIVFIPVLDDLDEEDNAVTELPGDVESFIRFESPTVQIPPQVVKPIQIEDFKKVSERLRDEQEKLLRDNAFKGMAGIDEADNDIVQMELQQQHQKIASVSTVESDVVMDETFENPSVVAKRIEHYNEQVIDLQNSAKDLMSDAGITSQNKFSKPSAPEEMPHVSNPTEGNVLDKFSQKDY